MSHTVSFIVSYLEYDENSIYIDQLEKYILSILKDNQNFIVKNKELLIVDGLHKMFNGTNINEKEYSVYKASLVPMPNDIMLTIQFDLDYCNIIINPLIILENDEKEMIDFIIKNTNAISNLKVIDSRFTAEFKNKIINGDVTGVKFLVD